MRKFYPILLLLLSLIACRNQDQNSSNSLLNTSNLETESFTIDITKDTTLLSKKGAVIKIPKGSLSGKEKMVKLVIKEAYAIEDILKAGLTTTSNGAALSSGGMIYINTSNPETENISGPISIAIPTSSIDRDMKLFSGEEKDGKLDWVEPVDLPASPQTSILDQGAAIFRSNCASCHSLDKDLTGPPLAHIVKRSKKIAEKEGQNYLYEFTLNFNRVVRISPYYRAMACSRAAVMNIFEGALTNSDLDKLYSFIENESNSKKLPIPPISNCSDSCFTYNRIVDSLRNRLGDLATPVPMVIEKNIQIEKGPFDPANTIIVDTLVSPLQHQSYFYQFTVSQSGWFNVDKLLNMGYSENVLICSPKQTNYEKINYYLVIPSFNAVIPGGPIKQEGRIGFFSINGTIPLPTGIKAYIIALGEFEDKIIFSKIEFQVQRRQDFELDMQFITKEQFKQIIASLNFQDAEFTVEDTKNASQLRETIRDIKEAQKLKPSNCDCDCYTRKDVPELYVDTN